MVFGVKDYHSGSQPVGPDPFGNLFFKTIYSAIHNNSKITVIKVAVKITLWLESPLHELYKESEHWEG